MNSEIENDANPKGRVIGFDSHPDSFTAALLRGPTPAAAITEKVFNKIPIQQLPGWAQKHTTAEDLFVLEASGNSFEVVRTLGAIGRKAKCPKCGKDLQYKDEDKPAAPDKKKKRDYSLDQ